MILPLLIGLAAAATAAPAPQAAGPTPEAGGWAVSVTSVLVRRTPSLPGPVIDEAKGHTLFHIIGCQADGWCALDLGSRGGVGYLPAGVLSPVPPPAAPAA